MKATLRIAVTEAMRYHESTGALAFVAPPRSLRVGNAKWTVRFEGTIDPIELSWEEARVVCFALNAGERAGWTRGAPT